VQLQRHSTCLNCGAATPGEYCPDCGQRNADYHTGIFTLLGWMITETLDLDSRLGRTIGPFLFKPGVLTRAYNSGQRARYTSPLRLYIIASAVFFLALSISDRAIKFDPPERATRGSPEERQKRADKLQIKGFGWLGRQVEQKLKRVAMQDEEAIDAFKKRAMVEFAATVPKMMFLLVPLFAALLKLFWRKNLYVDHLMLALHEHAFAFVLLLPAVLWGEEHSAQFAMFGVTVHGLGALKTVYGQTWGKTLAKGFAAGFLYMLAVGFFTLLALFIGLYLAA
jgi:hypothetical protein